MEDYKTYLAEQVLSEDKIVTYRILSRALKVNVNVAKQMLYEFHAWQNDKRSGSVHATYMLYGTRKPAHTNGHSQQDGDVIMASSPPEAEVVADDGPVVTLSVVAEESLKDILSQYESISSIHVYSLGTHPVKDLHLLADVSKPINDAVAEDGSANPPHSFGPVRNPYVRRRERQGASPRPTAAIPKASDAKPPASKQAPATQVKEEAAPEQKAPSKESTPVLSGSKKPPAVKRGASGGIMQSFAKAASKPKKASTPQPAKAIAADDSPMQELSDDGEDDTVAEPSKEDDTAINTRKARQEELKRMMEEDSEDEEPDNEDTPMEEPEEFTAPEPEQDEKPEPAEVVSSASNGRRRGKRRVMKKKTVMDDQGYLVTVQESGWESFSEDEPAPPAAKKKTEASSQPAKPKKPAAKGQGNIMSFFSKK
ncbi:CDC27 protein [Diaporthe australafricana]|uniref:DNA polymerase delta subunit 3 n=1 Tax=Diaporthe australafricana TaxID=127596 RepID=A0ABR3X1U6_9PEZI